MSGARKLAGDHLALFAGLEALLWTTAALLTNVDTARARANLVVALLAAGLAALGLFLVRGDEGHRLLNAARSLLVLLGLVGAVIALLIWAAGTQGGGS